MKNKKTITVSSLIGGVSTQPEATRPPQQAELSDNAIGTVIEGLRKRPPATKLSYLDAFLSDDAAYHDVSLDESQYIVGIDSDGSVRVFDQKTGVSQEVYTSAGQIVQAGDIGYVQSDTPRKSLRFLSLADYTLIMNRDVVTRPSAELHREARKEAVVTVAQGSYSADFRIEVRNNANGNQGYVTYSSRASNGLDQASNTTAAIGVDDIVLAEVSAKTEIIAEYLARTLNGEDPTGFPIQYQELLSDYQGLNPISGPSSWEVTHHGPHVLIKNLNGDDFDVTIEESIGEAAMRLTYKEVQLFTDLPTSSPVGLTVQVIGDPEKQFNSYWVQFRPHDDLLDNEQSAGTWASGYWEESVAPGISKGLDPSTMPHALIRFPDTGKWLLTPLDGTSIPNLVSANPAYTLPKYKQRRVGDLTSNEDPEFVGKRLRDMCFHQGRLALLGEQSLSISETREPFSFYRTTVLDLLASDRIELDTPVQKSETLSHCTVLGGDIVLMSEDSQYLIRSVDGGFSSTSISVTAAGAYNASPVASPVQVKNTLFVPRSVGDYGSVGGLVVQGDQRPRMEFFDITGGVPKYLEVPHAIAATPQLDVCVTYSEDSTNLYVYSEYNNAGEKRHQSWQRWNVLTVDKILHVWFEESALRVLVKYQNASNPVVLQFDMEPNATDSGEPPMCLDVRSLLLPGGTYDSSTNTTTYPVDFAVPGGQAREAGTRKVLKVNGWTEQGLVLDGNTTSKTIWAGQVYQMRHDLSRIKDLDQNGVPYAQGFLRLDIGAVHYDKSGAFEVLLIDNFGGETASSNFHGSYLGQGSSYNEGRVSSGILTFPVRAEASDVRVSIRSTSTEPVRLVAMEIEARRARPSMGRRG